MWIKVNEDDAFREVAKILKKNEEELNTNIISILVKLGILDDDTTDAGQTLNQLREAANYKPVEFYKIIFKQELTEEVLNYLGQLKVMAFGADDPCPECGCELDREDDFGDGHEWQDIKCTNGYCTYEWSTEPDWDSLPGGADYD